jgi:hypothetical protein
MKPGTLALGGALAGALVVALPGCTPKRLGGDGLDV